MYFGRRYMLTMCASKYADVSWVKSYILRSVHFDMGKGIWLHERCLARDSTRYYSQ